MSETTMESSTAALRARILAAAAALIRAQGADAATTRAVAAAACVQAPAIYRLFSDKDALLDAVAEYELARYVAAKKSRVLHPDPVEALRNGWNQHVAFGLANPGLFWIMGRNAHSSAAKAGLKALAERVHAIALAGRLQGSEERASAMVHASCIGTIMSLLADDTKTRTDLSANIREAVLTAITMPTDCAPVSGVGSAASTLRARLQTPLGTLTPGERALLDELLLRLSNET